MRIVGYCMLWAIAFALLVAMCTIIKQGHIRPDGARDSDIVADKASAPVSAEPPAPKPISHASLPSV